MILGSYIKEPKGGQNWSVEFGVTSCGPVQPFEHGIPKPRRILDTARMASMLCSGFAETTTEKDAVAPANLLRSMSKMMRFMMPKGPKMEPTIVGNSSKKRQKIDAGKRI